MAFIVQPATDLIVPLYRAINRRDGHEMSKFFQAAFRTGLAAAMFFLQVMGNKAIDKTIEPSSLTHLFVQFSAWAIILVATVSVHPYVSLLSATASMTYRAAKRADLYLAPFQLASIMCGLYVASEFKPFLSDYKLDRKITDLSKTLAGYFFTTPR
ncbi:MAG: hypothetical protein JSS10_05560 [Verrucomicrobia bacterium]|nr:hypothetical protein [Verrucomicrobiota bacterium]